jgi:rare lipoprotein A (peptidoglycan hydrolase)
MRAHTAQVTEHERFDRRAFLRAVAIIVAILALVGAIGSETAAAGPAARSSWAPHLQRKIVPTRSTNLGMQIATWYGPGFFGHGTACGGTLTPHTWGIAHRTLPCGSLVTLSYHGRKVTVPVIDRGPYSGASIDLTSRTKSYLHFTSGKVRLTRVRHFRMLPRPFQGRVGTFAAAH